MLYTSHYFNVEINDLKKSNENDRWVLVVQVREIFLTSRIGFSVPRQKVNVEISYTNKS